MYRLNVEKRNIENKTNELRGKNIIPGNLYGPSIESMPVKMNFQDLRKASRAPGEVYRVRLGRRSLLTKLGEIQRDPVSKKPIHFSLVELPRNEESKIEVPVDLRGHPVGLKKGGVLVVLEKDVTVKGKPNRIPEYIEGDISDLDIGDKLVVDDLNSPKKATIVDDDTKVVAICTPPLKVDSSVGESESETDTTEFKSSDQSDPNQEQFSFIGQQFI